MRLSELWSQTMTSENNSPHIGSDYYGMSGEKYPGALVMLPNSAADEFSQTQYHVTLIRVSHIRVSHIQA